jgi:methylenetetrahydrofolate reductase (NADPH)
VGAYPEPHPEAADAAADVRWLKRKFQAGADSAITQFFFEAETFLRFRDACAKAGIDTARIIPGIIPIENWSGIRKFALATGTSVPAWMDEAFEKAARDGREDLLATALCTELCDRLMAEGVPALHFYTLNRPTLTRDVCHALGVSAQVALQNVA